MWSFQSESTAVVTITVFEFGCYALSAPYTDIDILPFAVAAYYCNITVMSFDSNIN